MQPIFYNIKETAKALSISVNTLKKLGRELGCIYRPINTADIGKKYHIKQFGLIEAVNVGSMDIAEANAIWQQEIKVIGR